MNTAPLDSVVESVRQGANLSRLRADDGAHYRLIQVSNLEPFGIPRGDLKEELVDQELVKKFVAKEGQILLSLFATKLRAAEVSREVADAPAFVGNNIAVITPNPKKGVLGSYLLAVLNSQAFHARMERLTGGSTIAQISVSELKDIEVPVPDRRTQERIGHAFWQFRELVNGYEQLRAAQQDLLEHDILDVWEGPVAHG